MKIDLFRADEILRLTRISGNSVTIADKILELEVAIFPTLPPIRVEDLDDLWETQFPTAPSTYALYVYALYPVSYLLNAYEVSGRIRYLESALALAESFLAWETSDGKRISKKRYRILLGDHAVSNRTQCLCYLVASLLHAGKDLPNSLGEALLRNGEYLSELKNYSHYNHGLMMDLALLGLLNTLRHMRVKIPGHFRENLVTRLEISMTRDLTSDGVHVENSPGYHFWILGFLRKISEPIYEIDRGLHERANMALSRAVEYGKYIARPDGTIPTIGDTHAGLRYSPSKGLKSKAFLDSNQVIFRDVSDDIWCFLGSGYKTHVHKHADNGSFILHYKGRDIFADSGFLNYEGTDESRAIKSVRFHNTVAPEGRDQTITKVDLTANGGIQSYGQNLSRSGLLSYGAEDSYEYAVVRISDYDDLELARAFVWIKGSGFFVYDVPLTPGPAKLEHFFNIGDGLRLQVSDAETSVYNQETKVCVVRPLTVDDRSSVEIAIEQAFFADGFSSKRDTDRLVIRSTGWGCLIQIDFSGDGAVQACGAELTFIGRQCRCKHVIDLRKLISQSLSSENKKSR